MYTRSSNQRSGHLGLENALAAEDKPGNQLDSKHFRPGTYMPVQIL